MTAEVNEFHRLLATNSTDDTLVSPNDSEVLKDTLRVYGTCFLVLFLLYCWARLFFPRVFNVRSWAPLVESDQAKELSYGYLNWVWKVWMVSNADIRDNCGLDALCYVRVLRLGFRLACVGIFNSIYLFPVYKSAKPSDETAHITDNIVEITVTNCPPGSPRFMATVLAAYVFFGFTMYTLLKEFEWFTKHRHFFLSRYAPRNYSVFIRHIPPEYQSSGNLLHFFRQLFSKEAGKF